MWEFSFCDCLRELIYLVFFPIILDSNLQINYNLQFNFNNRRQSMKQQIKTAKKDRKLHHNTEKELKSNQGNRTQSESRFKKMHYDPKFVSPNPQQSKVKIDERFSKMMTDPRFSVSGARDKYGRKIKNTGVNKQLKQYYYLDEREQKEQIGKEGQVNEEEEAEQDNNEEDHRDSNVQQELEEVEGEQNIRQWMQNYEEQSSEEMQEGIYDREGSVEDQEDRPENEDLWVEERPQICNQKVPVTKRLALCNYDWMNVGARDIMLVFNSFKPKDGVIISVRVYQSDYGKQKMEEQEIKGPQALFQNEDNSTQKKKKHFKKRGDQFEQPNQLQNIDQVKLRAYEKDRLRYFYAIITCNSKTTAQSLYEACDGKQFQQSNLPIDLRYVPDQIVNQLPEDQLKEECNEVPSTGELKDTLTRVNGHSKMTLTWEDPDLTKIADLRKKNWNKMKDEELDKIDWAMYLDEEGIEEGDQVDNVVGRTKSSRKDKDIQIAFDDQVDQEQLSEEEEQLDDQELNQLLNESDWRKECNKKKHRKDDIQITFGSGFQSKSIMKPTAKPQFPSLNQQNKGRISKKQRQMRNQQNRKTKRQDDGIKLQFLADDNSKRPQFNANVQEDRFKAVYNNPNYQIDQTDPRFDHRRIGKVFEAVVKNNRDKHRY